MIRLCVFVQKKVRLIRNQYVSKQLYAIVEIFCYATTNTTIIS